MKSRIARERTRKRPAWQTLLFFELINLDRPAAIRPAFSAHRPKLEEGATIARLARKYRMSGKFPRDYRDYHQMAEARIAETLVGNIALHVAVDAVMVPASGKRVGGASRCPTANLKMPHKCRPRTIRG